MARIDYSPLPRPNYDAKLSMRGRKPQTEQEIKQGWTTLKWCGTLTIYCCNFCPYDSPHLHEVAEHSFRAHYLPFVNSPDALAKRAASEVAPVKSHEEQLADADRHMAEMLDNMYQAGDLDEALREVLG